MRSIFSLIIFLISNYSFAFPASDEWRYQNPYGQSYTGTASDVCVWGLTTQYSSNGTLVSYTISDHDGYRMRCQGTFLNRSDGIYIEPTRNKICPENSTLNGSECSCNSGYEENAGSCSEIQYDPCEMLANFCSGWSGQRQPWQKEGKSAGSWTCRLPTNVAPLGSPIFPGCNRGCMGENVGFSVSYQNDAGQWVSSGQAKMTGSTCDPSVIEDLNSESDPNYEKDPTPTPAPEPDKSCPNGFKGMVNGVEVCVPPKASSGVTELEEKDNGDGTKTSTKTEVKCENGKCEITKTSTTTNTQTNTTVSSSSVTTTVDKADYCSKNKTAGACKDEQGDNTDGNGKFGGSCEGGFTCEGDAVMCAMAKEQHKRACETLEPAKDGIWKQIEEGTDSGSAEAMKSEASTINISTQLDTSGYGLPRSCPADPVIELPFVSKTFTIPFSKACPILKTMSDVALLITALSLLVWLVAPRGKAE